MPRQPLSRERICEALESCRPGSSDLSAPELAEVVREIVENPHLHEVYEQIQKADAKIAAAFQQVEIPLGLEQRLIASLRLSQAEDAVCIALHDDADIASSSTLAKPAEKKERTVSRRWLIVGGGILTAAAALFLVAFLGINNSGGYSEKTVVYDAIKFFDADMPAARGQLRSQVPAPRRFPLSKAIRPFREIRWRTVQNFMGQEGVAFDLPAQNGVRATLYAVNRTFAALADSPTKPSNTAGCYVSAWQENGVLYVLVVRGNEQNYQQYLNLPGQVA